MEDDDRLVQIPDEDAFDLVLGRFAVGSALFALFAAASSVRLVDRVFDLAQRLLWRILQLIRDLAARCRRQCRLRCRVVILVVIWIVRTLKLPSNCYYLNYIQFNGHPYENGV